MRKLLLSTAVLAFASVGPVLAAPIFSVDPGSLTANGNVNAVFAFAAASDISQLLKLNVAGVIFQHGVDAVGTTKNVGPNSGLIQFQLINTTQNYSFVNDVIDSVDGEFHAKYGSTEADFGVSFGPINSPTRIALAALALQGPVTLVGFEDRRGGDYDFNDLIFAFSSVRVAVPEPASIALLGFSLLGAGMMRRSRPN